MIECDLSVINKYTIEDAIKKFKIMSSGWRGCSCAVEKTGCSLEERQEIRQDKVVLLRHWSTAEAEADGQSWSHFRWSPWDPRHCRWCVSSRDAYVVRKPAGRPTRIPASRVTSCPVTTPLISPQKCLEFAKTSAALQLASLKGFRREEYRIML